MAHCKEIFAKFIWKALDVFLAMSFSSLTYSTSTRFRCWVWEFLVISQIFYIDKLAKNLKNQLIHENKSLKNEKLWILQKRTPSLSQLFINEYVSLIRYQLVSNKGWEGQEFKKVKCCCEGQEIKQVKCSSLQPLQLWKDQ